MKAVLPLRRKCIKQLPDFFGSPIRLLGVGLLNLEPAGSPTQQELFDFGKEKKQKLDQVVLDLKTKNPGIPITKARLLNKTQTPNASEKGDL